jgi:branched-chain amino acid transport system substrate-binding protein
MDRLRGYGVPLTRSSHVVLLLVTGLAISAGSAGCTKPATKPATNPASVPPTGPVTIGLVTAATGVDASTGIDAQRGAQVAVDVINGGFPDLAVPLGPGTGLPGLGGAQVRLVTAEAAGPDDRSRVAVDGLVDRSQVAGVVVVGTAGQSGAAAKEAERRGVPLIDAYNTADDPDTPVQNWSFRLAPTDLTAARTALLMLTHDTPPGSLRSLAVLVGTGANTTNQGRALRQTAIDLGFPASVLITVNPKQTDHRTLAHTLDSYGLSATLALASTEGEATAIADTIRQLRHPVPLIGLGRGFADLRDAPPGVPTFVRGVAWSADLFRRDPLGTSVADLFQRRFNTAMSEAGAAAFTATLALAEAVDSAGTAQAEPVRTSLRQLTVPATELVMPWNGIAWGPDGQNSLAAAVIEQGSDNVFQVVFPPEVASTPLRWTGHG